MRNRQHQKYLNKINKIKKKNNVNFTYISTSLELLISFSNSLYIGFRILFLLLITK